MSMKAYTVTVENNSKFGKTCIEAHNYTQAHTKARFLCPPGFQIVEIIENSKEQHVGFREREMARLSKGLQSSHGRAAERCSNFAPSNASELSSRRASKGTKPKNKKATVIVKAGVNVAGEKAKQAAAKKAAKAAVTAEKKAVREKARLVKAAQRKANTEAKKAATAEKAKARRAAKAAVAKAKPARKAKKRPAKKAAPKKLKKRPGFEKPSKK
jgi:hypothetical protein